MNVDYTGLTQAASAYYNLDNREGLDTDEVKKLTETRTRLLDHITKIIDHLETLN